VSHMLYKTAQSSKAHRTESVSVTGHELTMGVSSKDRTRNSKTSLAWQYTGDHDWLIQTPVSTVQ